MKKLKVLVKAHEFGMKGSEAKHAYNLLSKLSYKTQLTIIHSYSNQFLDHKYTYEISDFDMCTNFISIKYPKYIKLLINLNRNFKFFNKSIGFPPLYFLILKFWEYRVYKYIKSKENDYDIIHSLNHISFREPGFLYKLNGAYIHGPISGFYNIPTFFAKDKRTYFILFFRNKINSLNYLLNRRLRKAINKSKCYLYVNDYDNKFPTQNNQQFPDVGYNNLIVKNNNKIKISNKYKVSVVGRFEWLKGSNILNQIFCENPELFEKFEVNIYGHVNETEKFNFNQCFNFHGEVAHDVIIESLRDTHLLIHLSIKEATSLSILEALSNGCNVICHRGFGIDILNSKNINYIDLIDVDNTVLNVRNFLMNYSYNFYDESYDIYNYDFLVDRLVNLYDKSIEE